MSADTYGAKAGARIADSYPSTSDWDSIYFVSTTDATTTGQSLVDVTGLVAPVTHASTYEFEAHLLTVASADTNGIKVGVNLDQTPVTVEGEVSGNGTGTTLITPVGLQANNTADATALNTSSSGKGHVYIKGYFVTHATLDSNFSIQHLKLTSGTSTVKVGSSLRLRKVG